MRTDTELDNLLDWVEGMRKRVREIAQEWESEEGNLIMILHAIENELGYVPRGVANELSQELGVPMARIYEVITFYHYFRLAPRSKHTVKVCMGTACYLKGANALLEEIEQQLELREATGAQKGECSVESVRCIGCCGMAPAIVLDDETHGRVCLKAMKEILKQQLEK